MMTKNGWRASWTRVLQDLDPAKDAIEFRAERTSRGVTRVEFTFANATNTSGDSRSPRYFDVPKGAFIEATVIAPGPNTSWAWIAWDGGSVGFECPFAPLS